MKALANYRILKEKCNSENESSLYDIKIKDLENEITELSADFNAKTIEEHVKKLSDSEGKLSQLGLWKIKKIVAPKNKDPPMAKFDEHGNLITGQEPLKRLCLDTYKKN